MARLRAILIWAAAGLAIALPLAVAAASPLLEWRGPVYIAAGFAGIVGMSLLFLQPILAAGLLPGLKGGRGRRLHRAVGAMLLLSVVLHVAGLWLTSPPDVIDALLFRSPTPFSDWGVIALAALVAAALLAAFRRRLPLRPMVWRRAHATVALAAVLGSVLHAMLIVGTMGTATKTALCILTVAACIKAFVDLRIWSRPLGARR